MEAGSSAALTRLLKLHPKRIDLSLDRIKRLLERLGNPQCCLPPVVHVAGTNGKGSVIAMMRAALETARKRVHVYTSPHLVSFQERIRIAGELIAEKELTAVLEECEEANASEPITFFEITTAAAFLAFSRAPADIVLLETGLGGRLDATNLIQSPIVTLITPVSLDHQQFLGDNIAAIAAEKAGILKFHVPCVLARQDNLARDVILGIARAINAPVIEQEVDWRVSIENENLLFADANNEKKFPLPALPGAHQINNAGVAIAALMALGELAPSLDDISLGLRNVKWPARLQHLKHGLLIQTLPRGWELWLDGGHNAAAGQSIAQHIDAAWSEQPLHLIFGMMNSKQADAFIMPLVLRAQSVRTVAIPDEKNSFTADDLARFSGGGARPEPSVSDAVASIISDNDKPGRILICGSLYLAGKVLAKNT